MAISTTTRLRVGAMALATLALAACGESAPSTFNASGTASDVGAVSTAFDSPVLQSFTAFTYQMNSVSGGQVFSTAQLGMHGTGAGTRAAAEAFAAQTRRLLPSTAAAGFSASVGVLPDSLRGKTFVYDSAQGKYVMSARTGAPSNGVRFVLYAVDPVTHDIVSPLNETGYADLLDLSSGSTRSARLEVVSGSTTYLDYTAAGTVTSTGGDVRVSGFVTNGEIRANFDLDTKIVGTSSSETFTLDHSLDIPQRNVKLHYLVTLQSSSGAAGTASINLSLKGPNGWVDIVGQETEGTGGSYDVKVNGQTFATITSDGSSTVTITGKSGQPLTSDEQNALRTVFQAAGNGFEIFAYLLSPLGAFFGA